MDHKLIKKTDTYRSHILYSRKVGEEKPKWKIRKMRDEIFEAYEEFIAQLPISERPNWKIQNKK